MSRFVTAETRAIDIDDGALALLSGISSDMSSPESAMGALSPPGKRGRMKSVRRGTARRP